MKVLAIVQARCSSSRLPSKVIKELAGKPMIIQELDRLSRSKMIDKIVLATSTEISDEPLAKVVVDEGFTVYRGNLDDVLDRYYCCAKEYQPMHVVRITGDCPVIDWRLVDKVIKTHIEHCNDYTCLSEEYPDGLDTEVMKFSALEEACRKARFLSEREHVTLYFRNHENDFRIETISGRENWGAMRWTVDEPQDFVFITQVFAELYSSNKDFSMDDILLLLKKKPKLRNINQGIKRNEGLIKSLEYDKII